MKMTVLPMARHVSRNATANIKNWIARGGVRI